LDDVKRFIAFGLILFVVVHIMMLTGDPQDFYP
jgi:hypothetical protein